MFTLADLRDPGAVLSFRAAAASRGACDPPLDWLAFIFQQGRTFASALDEAALTAEGRAWCLWCRKNLSDWMDESVRFAFLRAALTEDLAFVFHFNPLPNMTTEEEFFVLMSWHSAGGKVTRRRKAAERREALK